MANTNEQRKQITIDIMNKLEEALRGVFDDVIYTGDNTNTLTFEAGTVDEKDLWGSIKFTLHKPNWDVNKEMEKYFDKVEEDRLTAKNRQQAKEEKERKLAAQREKAAKRKQKEEMEIAKKKKNIANLKAKLGEDAVIEEE